MKNKINTVQTIGVAMTAFGVGGLTTWVYMMKQIVKHEKIRKEYDDEMHELIVSMGNILEEHKMKISEEEVES